MKVTIRQRPTEAAKYFGLDRLDLAVHPSARQSVFARKERDQRTFVTGLNENAPSVQSIADPKTRAKKIKEIQDLKKDLEAKLGVDLGPHSDYWLEFEIDLVEVGGHDLTWDLDLPLDKLKYTVALAGRFVADSYEQLSEPEYLNTFLYVHNSVQHTSRKVEIQELMDEVAGKISLIKNSREKLFYICSGLALPVNQHMDRESLYMQLINYRSKLKSIEEWSHLKDEIEKDNTTLQIQYVVDTAMRRHKFGKEAGQWTYKGTPLGGTKLDVISELSLTRQQELLAQILEEFLPHW
ncbi:hypothetical protein GCM10028806_34330 [Spirosoma terrae]|uniref:Uncharacterized protein n=1 Tax=Spirosoma terrae TaxID=1968276 RepID=A0A6L9L5C3_9BACT|nr:hypothetical protein [Spirosoma terrae]NDU95746.1 hypothetical protein [Spirosoma terrae]